jgi:dihydroxy-acid dehydratase
LEGNHFPFSGACDTATSGNTAGIYTEALGLALPGSGTLPAGSTYQLRAAKYTGMRVVDLLAEDLRPSNILTRDAFENAMRVGMAVGGSTNMVLHFTAMAKEAGVDVSFETWDALSRTTPTLRYSHYRTRWQDGWGNWHWGRCDPKWWGRGAFQQT